MAWIVLMLVALVIAASGLVLTIINLAIYRPPPPADAGEERTLVSVCVPARNEEENLDDVIRGLLASEHRSIEVLVYDDESSDATPRILAALAKEDDRLRPVATRPLPEGWVGKQFACAEMARAARGEWLLFTDADVRFEPACIGRALAAVRRLDASLISTFPRQITGTLAESAVVPLIHFILFSYLPMPRMRESRDPSASAGCGQFLLVRRDVYEAVGGHGAVRDSMHEGIKLPRLLRRAGHHTDLFDGTDLLSCRMYRGLKETWRGFAKNAYEGLGSFWLLLVLTILHAVAHVLPWVALVGVLAGRLSAAIAPLAIAAISMVLVQRVMLARRFRQPPVGVLLHPLGIVAMTVIQWQSLLLWATGRRMWRGRTAAAAGAA